jgi:hypothetical protein
MYPQLKKYTIIPGKKRPTLPPTLLPISKTDCVKVYPQCNFKGVPKELCSGNPVGVSSVFLRNLVVKDFSTRLRKVNHVEENIFNNPFSSILLEEMDKTKAGCIHAYTEPCFAGDRWEICNSINNLNINIISFRFGPSINSIEIYPAKDFGGRNDFSYGIIILIERKTTSKNTKSIKILK